MKAKHLAICIKNRQGFTITGREIEDGQVILRMQNFRQGDTNVITLDPEGVTRLREYLQALEAKAGVPQMTQEQSTLISDRTREAYVHAHREPVLARPEHGCSVEQAMALTMERYGQPGGALEQLAELERDTPPLVMMQAVQTELACDKCNRAPSQIAVCQHWECGVYSREVKK